VTGLLDFLLDPNVIYILLVAALWMIVTAITIPGTGVIEGLAVIGVLIALFLLANVPANWIAVMLIVSGGLSFLVLPLLDQRFLIVALVGLVLQALGGFGLLSTGGVSVLVLMVVMIISLLYTRFALIPVLNTQHAGPHMLEDQSLVGMRGVVQTTINPVGTVYVHGESWTAKRADDDRTPIDAGSDVVVRDRDGLTVFVEPLKRKRDDDELDMME
jgi:membrane-bound ClpP family serine protease